MWARKRIEIELRDPWLSHYFKIDRNGDNRVTLTLKVKSLIEDTPYQSLCFAINYHDQHPFHPPKIFFGKHFIHPNVIGGYLYVPSLTGNDWCPAQTALMTALTILTLLREPFICDEVYTREGKGKEEASDVEVPPFNNDAYEMWMTDPESYQLFVN